MPCMCSQSSLLRPTSDHPERLKHDHAAPSCDQGLLKPSLPPNKIEFVYKKINNHIHTFVHHKLLTLRAASTKCLSPSFFEGWWSPLRIMAIYNSIRTIIINYANRG